MLKLLKALPHNKQLYRYCCCIYIATRLNLENGYRYGYLGFDNRASFICFVEGMNVVQLTKYAAIGVVRVNKHFIILFIRIALNLHTWFPSIDRTLYLL